MNPEPIQHSVNENFLLKDMIAPSNTRVRSKCFHLKTIDEFRNQNNDSLPLSELDNNLPNSIHTSG